MFSNAASNIKDDYRFIIVIIKLFLLNSNNKTIKYIKKKEMSELINSYHSDHLHLNLSPIILKSKII